MLKHKYTNIIAIAIVLASIIGVILMIKFGDTFLVSYDSNNMSYQSKIFDESYVHSIDIVIDEEDFQNMLDNAADKEYVDTTVVIDDEEFNNVAIRTKGNSSLRDIVTMDSDRYSFKIEFDHYDDNLMYYGLDKLTLNNMYQDPTYLKDYFSYDMMEYIGINAPLASFVNVTVNGENWGLYVAVEAVEDSFLERSYTSLDGNLYKPEGTNEVGMEDMVMQDKGVKENIILNDDILNQTSETLPETSDENIPELSEDGLPPEISDENIPELSEGQLPPEINDEDMPELSEGQLPSEINNENTMGRPPMLNDLKDESQNVDEQTQDISNKNSINQNMSGMNNTTSSGADLRYTDDEYDSYSDIFDNAKTNISNSDKEAVISALKTLSTGENLEEAIEVDSVIDYFVVHNFLLNYDSYTGDMLHNYYLYEEDGILSVIPWDYNLSLGTFIYSNNETATKYVNYPIDTPTTVDIEERPLLYQLLNNETYLDEYHNSFDEFISSYFTSGYFEDKVDSITEMIAPYVEKDSTAFYTYDEFVQGSEVFKEFCLLRAQSIEGQLNGTIPATTDGQLNTTSLIDASYITMSVLGSKKVN